MHGDFELWGACLMSLGAREPTNRDYEGFRSLYIFAREQRKLPCILNFTNGAIKALL